MHIWTIHIVSPVCGSFPFTIDRNSRSVLSWIFDVLIQMIVSPKHDTTLATGHICPPRWGGKLYNNLYQTVSPTWCEKKTSVAISLPCSTQRKMACWGPPHPFPYTSFKISTITKPWCCRFNQVQPWPTCSWSIPPRPGSCLLCLLVHPGSKEWHRFSKKTSGENNL